MEYYDMSWSKYLINSWVSFGTSRLGLNEILIRLLLEKKQ